MELKEGDVVRWTGFDDDRNLLGVVVHVYAKSVEVLWPLQRVGERNWSIEWKNNVEKAVESS